MADIDVRVSMKDADNSVKNVKDALDDVKKSATAADKAIDEAGKGSGKKLHTTVKGIKDAFSKVNSTIGKTGSLLGFGLSGAVAIRTVFNDWARDTQMVKEGLQDIIQDMRGEAVLQGAMGAGLIESDTIAKLEELKQANKQRGLNLMTGDYTEAASVLAGATGMQGQDIVEAVKVAMEVWAAGGGAGTLKDAALAVSQTIAVGETGTLRTKGIFLDEAQLQGMDISEKGIAAYELLKKKVEEVGTLEQFMTSIDPRARLMRSEINAKTAEEEFKQREAGGFTTELKTVANEYRAEQFNKGINVDSLYNYEEYFKAKAIDPTSDFGKILNNIIKTEMVGGGEFVKEKEEEARNAMRNARSSKPLEPVTIVLGPSEPRQ